MSVLEALDKLSEKNIFNPITFLKTKNNMYHVYPFYLNICNILKKKKFTEIEALNLFS